jgi:hypothetical protein
MPKILYADHHRMTFSLATLLSLQGLQVDTLGGEDAPIRFAQEGHDKRLAEYDGLVAHLGTAFIPCIRPLLNEFPKLRIALVSEFPSEYCEVSTDKRLMACGYDSPRLVPFLRGEEAYSLASATSAA